VADEFDVVGGFATVEVSSTVEFLTPDGIWSDRVDFCRDELQNSTQSERADARDPP
jgi:hypothetical protein